MQTKTKKIVVGMVSGIFGLCAVSGVCLGGALSKANSPEPTVITMEKGASLRFNAGAPALRYFGTLSDVKDGADYGMIIVNADALSTVSGDYHANLTAGSYTDVSCVPYENNGATYIRAALTGFSTENFNESFFTDYVAIGYEKSSDGVYTYATVDETYGRSIVDAAKTCDGMEKEWTAQEQEAIDYFVSVADSQISDDFTGGLSATTFTAKNAEVEAYAEIIGVQDGELNVQLYTDIYQNISSVEFDMYVPTLANWVGVTFGTDGRVYASPVTFSKSAIAANETTVTTQNSVSYDLTKNWTTFKFVMNSSSEADVYINDVKAYTISGYSGTNANNGGVKSFTDGRIYFASASNDNVMLIDNVRVCYGENQVMEQDFSAGFSPMVSSNVSLVHNGIKVEASEYTGNGYFLYDNASSVSPSYERNHLKTNTYSGITEMGFDVSVTGGTGGATGNGLYVLYGVTSCYYPIIKITNSTINVNSNCGTAVNASGATVTKYAHDFTTKTFVKIVPTGAEAAEVYVNGDKVLTLTVTDPVDKFGDLTGSQYLWFAQADYAAVVKLDNVYVTTASGTVTENFDTLVSSSSSSVVFTNMSMTNLQAKAADYYRQGVDFAYTYDVYKSSNGLTVNKGYEVPETAEDTDTVLSASVTLKASAASIVLGENAAEKGLSLIVIEDGKVFLRNVTDGAIVDGTAIDGDFTAGATLVITMTAAGEVSVSIGDGAASVLGTATYVGGNFAILETGGVSAAYVQNVTLKMKVYA